MMHGLSGVDTTAPKLVSQGELVSLINQWDRPLAENEFYAAALKLREEARKAMSLIGDVLMSLYT